MSPKEQVFRPFRSVSPSVWGDTFLTYDNKKTEADEKREEILIEDLREQVRKDIAVLLLGDDHHPNKKHLELLKLIDAIQRLGISYYFEEEISNALQHVYEAYGDHDYSNYGGNAIWFRLLRQHGFYVSCDILNNYKDEHGVFKESFSNDVEEMLELYEATDLRVQGEVVLEEALEFTRTRLSMIVKDPLRCNSTNLSTHIQEALQTPLHKRRPRTEALSYIRFYEKQASRNESLLKLAKLGFNLVQSLHRSELTRVSKWWKNIDAPKNLPYVRDRIVESYFWAFDFYSKPKYSLSRIFLAKVIQVMTILDDTYDAYGTYEELVIFTEAVERYIPLHILNNYKDEHGVFKESFSNDVEEMLELYEATDLRVQGEVVLEEALEFTRTRLSMIVKDPLRCNSTNLSTHIQEALQTPLHKRRPRTEALSYIRFYEKQASRNESLLKLAKLGFNLVQSLHRSELTQVSKWWKNIDTPKNLPYVRDRIVESYFWAFDFYSKPKYSLSRITLAKFIQVTTLLDDTYDAYGTYEELVIFTEAVERWSITCLDGLPEYMKLAYQVLLDLYQEMEPVMEIEEMAPLFNRSKEFMIEFVKGYMSEAKWVHDQYKPTADEHASIAYVTGGGGLMMTTFYLGMGDVNTKASIEWTVTDPPLFKAASAIGRLLNDISGYKKEQEREHFPSCVQCYMKQYDVTEQHAVELVQKKIEDMWKDINRESLMCKDVPRPLIMVVIDSVRTLYYIYKYNDNFSEVEEDMKDLIRSLFIYPISI